MFRKILNLLSRKWVLNGFILGVTFLFALIVLNLPFGAKQYGDMDFHIEAKIISKVVWEKGHIIDSVKITKAPGPVLFYAIPYILTGPEASEKVYWISGVIWNMMWLALAIILLKDTAIMIFGKNAGLIVVALTFLLPLHLYYGMGILAETMAFVGFILFIFGTIRLFRQEVTHLKTLVMIIAGLLFMVTARPNSLLILGLIPLAILWFWVVKKNLINRQYLKKMAGAWITVSLMVIVLLSIIKALPGNQKASNQESYFSFVAHIGRFQFRTEPWDWRFWDNNNRPDSKDYQEWSNSTIDLEKQIKETGKDRGKVFGQWVLNDVIQYPGTVLKQTGVRFLFGNFLQVSSLKPERFKLGPFKGKWVYYLIHSALNIFNGIIIIGAFFYFIQYFKNKPYLLFIIIPWVALIAFHCLIYMEQRYLYPVRPFLILMASPLFIRLFSRNKTLTDEA